MRISLTLSLLVALLAGAAAFVAPRALPVQRTMPVTPNRGTNLHMGGKVAKFGPFSPAVYAAKFVLGEKDLNKLRGKAISLHSQVITYFCNWAGTQGRMRNRVVKLAKTNGDSLGFLV